MQEIYAYGFRNPFRISIDPETNELWAADAGQNDVEEVGRVTAGGNHGWNIKEGSFFFLEWYRVCRIDSRLPEGVEPATQNMRRSFSGS